MNGLLQCMNLYRAEWIETLPMIRGLVSAHIPWKAGPFC